jgi:lipopolysaccharide biosynthesis regulator YciM
MTSPLVLYLNSNQQSKTDKLFFTNFSPYMNITTQRGSDDSQQRSTLQNAAMHFYNNRDYNKAIVNFEELFKSQNSPDSLVQFYYGISCLGAQHNQKAVEVFSKLSSKKNYLFYDQSKWYLALSYLQNHDKEATIRTLKEIIEEKGDYTSKALNLLEELN